MRRGATLARVATIRIESAGGYENSLTGERNTTMYRPAGIRLDNDGCAHYWMTEGITYTLDHDGTAWHVTQDTGHNPHYYRAAHANSAPHSAYATTLPGTDGDVVLDPARTYTLRLEGFAASRELVLSEVD